MNTGFIGIGSMGGMLVRALLRSRLLAPQEIWAANRSAAKVDALAADFPDIHIASAKQVAANCDLIFIASARLICADGWGTLSRSVARNYVENAGKSSALPCG